jgi:hypothetical protein
MKSLTKSALHTPPLFSPLSVFLFFFFSFCECTSAFIFFFLSCLPVGFCFSLDDPPDSSSVLFQQLWENLLSEFCMDVPLLTISTYLLDLPEFYICV